MDDTALPALRGLAKQPVRRFAEIEGLRAYLALWVAIGHGMQLSGYLATRNVVMTFLLSGHSAVVVFMIVSGFVITHLLLAKPEPYLPYITRRFFRLYPAYVLACVCGYLLTDDWVRIVREVPWAGMPQWPAYARSVVELYDSVTQHFWANVGLHAVLLHGVVPTEWLSRAAMTFLPAAWSISLEWQFYLVAPLVVMATRRAWSLAVVVLVALVLSVAYAKGLLGHYSIPSSLAGGTAFFAVGIASRLAYARLAALDVSPLAAAALVFFIGQTLLRDALPLVVWGVFFSFSLWQRNAPVTGAIFRLIFDNAAIRALGAASYSLYLFHRPTQVLFGSLMLGHLAYGRPAMFASQLAAIAAAMALSLVLYHVVEKPGERVGRRLANWLATSRGPRGPTPAVLAPAE